MSNGEKSREDKKKKEKKGMLSGLFKRKDKKGRNQEDDIEDEKISGELSRSSLQGKESSESLRQEQQPTKAQKPQRQTSKLQKQPPIKQVLAAQPLDNRRDVISPKPEPVQPLQQQQRVISPPPAKPAPSFNSLGAMQPINGENTNQPVHTASQDRPQETRDVPLSDEPPPEDPFEDQPELDPPKDMKRGVFSPIKDALLPSSMTAGSEPKPERVRKAKHRMPLDDFDSSADEGDATSPISPVQQPAPLHFNPPPQRAAPTLHSLQTEESRQGPDFATRAASQQNRHLSPPPTTQPPALDPDTSSASTAPDAADPVSPISTSSASSSALVPASRHRYPDPQNQASASTDSSLVHPQSVREETPASTTSATTTSTAEEAAQPPPAPASVSTHSTAPTWSDASLRAYMEDESEVRDLLLIVHDKSDVKKVNGRQHPLTKDLFVKEEERLKEIERRLDGMLGDFWGRRRRAQGVR